MRSCLRNCAGLPPTVMRHSESRRRHLDSVGSTNDCFLVVIDALHPLWMPTEKNGNRPWLLLFLYGGRYVLGLNRFLQRLWVWDLGIHSVLLARLQRNSFLCVYGLWFEFMGCLYLLGVGRRRKDYERCDQMDDRKE